MTRRAIRSVQCATLVLAFVPVIATAQTVNVLTDSVNVLTGGGSVYYQLGVALSDNFVKSMPYVKTSVQSTKSALENLNLLQADRGEIAFTPGDALYDAWKGNAEAGFKGPLTKLRGIAALYPNYVHIVARADSGIKTLADLKGRRASVGAPKSGVDLTARAILAAAGLSYKTFSKLEYLPFGESMELMKDRQIDFTLQSAGLGASAVRDLAQAIAIVVVPIPADVVKKIKNPAYLPGVIPANTYRGQTTDVPTAALQNFLVTREDAPADLVYGITKALWTQIDHVIAAHPLAKGLDLRHALDGMPVPLHPGAERYYKEVGVVP